MNILATQYSLGAKAFEIYLAGCKGPHCPGCHNPESWDFSQGKYWQDEIDSITYKITEFSCLIDRIYLLGGEPLDQDLSEIFKLASMLKQTGKEIWLFTGKSYEEVPFNLMGLIDYVKHGRYDDTLKELKEQYGVTLGSSNQGVVKVKEKINGS